MKMANAQIFSHKQHTHIHTLTLIFVTKIEITNTIGWLPNLLDRLILYRGQLLIVCIIYKLQFRYYYRCLCSKISCRFL